MRPRRSLGRQDSAEGEARLEICRGDIQFLVAAQRRHHLLGIDAKARGQRADLVRESDLHGMKGIAGVLDHLCRSQRDDRNFDGKSRVQIGDPTRGGIGAAADNKQRRPHEVLNGRSLPQKLRIRNDANVLMSCKVGVEKGLARSREDRAANHYGERFRSRLEKCGEVAAGAVHVAEVDVSIRLRGGADAKQDDIRGVHTFRGEQAGLESSLRDILLDQIFQARFKERRLGLAYGVDFVSIAIYAIYMVPELPQGRPRLRSQHTQGPLQ